MNRSELLKHKDAGEGRLEVTLDLAALYESAKDRDKFEKKYAKFSSLKENDGIVKEKGGGFLTYYSEHIIPYKRNTKPAVLLVFGNPASHSVKSGMFFSWQGDPEQEHRLWQALRRTRIFEFDGEDICLNNSERNEHRKKALFELTYASPFRIGLAVYYTMPSPASEKSWGGVVPGLRKLFGKKALQKIWEAERSRINELIHSFLEEDGAVDLPP